MSRPGCAQSIDSSCEACRLDHMRFLTKRVGNGTRGSEETIEVDLCPGARIYNFSLSAKWVNGVGEPGAPPPEILATWASQDSTLDLYSLGCSIASKDADLPGLAFPASSRLTVPAGVDAVLQIVYGHCK